MSRVENGYYPVHGQCKEHLNKLIFMTEQEVENYARIYRPWETIVAYPCPVKDHYHMRDQTKRNRKKRSRRRYDL